MTNTFSFLYSRCFKWIFLTIFAILVFFSGSTNQGIPKDQEGKGALIAKTMIKSGNYLDMTVPGDIESEKPIFSYWLCALSANIFGLDEFGLRLPTILAGIFTILMTCALGCRIYDEKVGFLSGYIVGTMIFFVYVAHEVSIDAELCAFYLAAMIFLYKGYFENYKATYHLYIFYIILAISVLVKGPASVLLIGLTVLFLIIYKRNLKIIWDLKPISGIIILSLLTIPWYIYECFYRDSKFGWDFFINQNISRFTGVDMSYKGGRRGSYLFYFGNLLYGAFPWSLLIPFSLYQFRKKLFKLSGKTYFLIFWIIAVFLFFTFAAIKRGDYILPLYPALAILIGRYIQNNLLGKKFIYTKAWNIACFVLLVIGLVAGLLVKIGLLNYIGKLAEQNKVMFVSAWDGANMISISTWINSYFLLTVLFLLILIALLLYLGRELAKGNVLKVVTICVLVTFLGIISYFEFLVPILYKYQSVKSFCVKAHRIIPKDTTICYYDDWNTEAVFFMNRKYVRTHDFYNEETKEFNYKYIVTDPDIYANLPPNIKDRLTVLLETIKGHRNPMVLLETNG